MDNKSQSKIIIMFTFVIILTISFFSFGSLGANGEESCTQYSTYKECVSDEGTSLIVHEYKYKDKKGDWVNYKENIDVKIKEKKVKVELNDKFKFTLNIIPTLNGIDSTWKNINDLYPNILFEIPIKKYEDGKIKFDFNLTNGGSMGENIPSNIGLTLRLEDKIDLTDSKIKTLNDGLLFFDEFKLWIPEGCAYISKNEIIYKTLSEYCLDPSLEVGNTITLGGNHEYTTVLVHSNGTININSTIGWLNLTATESINVYGEINGYTKSNYSGGGGGGSAYGCTQYAQGATGGTGQGPGGTGGTGGTSVYSSNPGVGGSGGSGASQVGTETGRYDLSQGYGGGGGGGGGNGDSTGGQCLEYGQNGLSGGIGGSGLRIYSPTIYINGTINMNGANGGTGGAGGYGTGTGEGGGGGGGGGGSSGGTILLDGNNVNITNATFNVAGGSGGTGGAGGAGSPGGTAGGNGGIGYGGRFKVFYASLNNDSITLTLGTLGTSHYELVDIIPPDINITYPINNSNFSTSIVGVNYTSGDATSCKWTNNSGATNNTITCGTNISQSWGDALLTIIVYGSDNSGNENSSSVTFRVDTTPPVSTPTMTSPPDGASYTNDTWTKDNVKITIIATDSGVGMDTLSYPLYCFDTSNTCTPTTLYSGAITNSSEGTTYIRFYANDTLDNQEIVKSRTIKIDKTPPNTSIAFPTPSLFLNYNTSINLNFSVSDFLSGVDTCEYSLDAGLTNISIPSCNNLTFNASEGSVTLNLYSNDSVNNLNNSELVTFTIDLTDPLMTFAYPLNTSYSSNVSSINYTYTEINCDSVWWNNGTDNSTRQNCGTNWTDLISNEGSNTWIVYINDSGGNENSTSITFFKDTIYPNINITFPQNNSNSTDNTLDINYTRSDTNLDSCWWTNNSGVDNYTLTDCVNITTETWADGTHNLIIYLNDSVNNINSSSITFTIDTTPPVLSIVHPADTASYSTNSIDLNYTTSDVTMGLETCWYRNHTDTTNITIACGTNTSISQSSDGTYTIYMWANDTLGNEVSDSHTYTISTTAPAITLIRPTNSIYLNDSLVWFNYTSVDANGVDTCQLWGNWTGTWHNNLSNVHNGDTSVDVNEGNFSQTISDGHYKWNLWCNDTNPTSDFYANNWTFTVDSTFPLISFETDTLANNTNTTNTYIYVNVSITETNEDTITFNLYNSSHGLSNSTSYTNSVRNITWTLPDGIYYYNVTINDSANNQNSTETRLIRLDDTKPSISIEHPKAQNYGTNNSMELNYTATDNLIGLDNCRYYILNSTNDVVKSEVTLSNCENDTFSLPGGDIEYTLHLFAKDLLGNQETKTVTFGIRTNSPVVVLTTINDTHINSISNNYFNFTVTTNADSISSCQLWGNWSGWHLNQTINNPSESIDINFSSLTLPEAEYLWNVNCSDNFGYYGWALNNNTFIVDLTFPEINITTLSTTPGSQTFDFNTSVTDTYLRTVTCKYSIFDSIGVINGLNENVSFICNIETSPTVTAYGTYNLTIYATDKAGNENSTTKSFTTSAAIGDDPGGGGGPPETRIIYGENSTWTMYTDNRGNSYDFFMAKGSNKERTIIFKNLEDNATIIDITCEDIVGGLCAYVVLSETNITLPPNVNVETSITLFLQLPEEIDDAIYDFTIKANARCDGSTGKISVRARVGEYGIMGWFINKIIGKTTLLGMELYNFFLLLLPLIILAPMMYFIVFTNSKQRLPITFLMTCATSFLILFVIG